VVVQGKGGDESTKRGSVHHEKQRTQNRGLGIPQEVYKNEKVLLHLTWKERDDKQDLNQLRTEPWGIPPNQDERRVRCYGRWSQRQQKGQGETDMITFVILLH